MQMKVIMFGRLKDITNEDLIELVDVPDTNAIVTEMTRRFPALGELRYAIAVGNEIIIENTSLKENDVVALLPPFSGG